MRCTERRGKGRGVGGYLGGSQAINRENRRMSTANWREGNLGGINWASSTLSTMYDCGETRVAIGLWGDSNGPGSVKFGRFESGERLWTCSWKLLDSWWFYSNLESIARAMARLLIETYLISLIDHQLVL